MTSLNYVIYYMSMKQLFAATKFLDVFVLEIGLNGSIRGRYLIELNRSVASFRA